MSGPRHQVRVVFRHELPGDCVRQRFDRGVRGTGRLQAEARRLAWYGVFDGDVLVAVGGLEHVRDAALLRHGYVLPEYQRHGVGALLLEHLERQARGVSRIIVGTYAGNYKARGALGKAGYRLSADPEAVLRAYYAIPERRLKSSVTYEKPL